MPCMHGLMVCELNGLSTASLFPDRILLFGVSCLKARQQQAELAHQEWLQMQQAAQQAQMAAASATAAQQAGSSQDEDEEDDM